MFTVLARGILTAGLWHARRLGDGSRLLAAITDENTLAAEAEAEEAARRHAAGGGPAPRDGGEPTGPSLLAQITGAEAWAPAKWDARDAAPGRIRRLSPEAKRAAAEGTRPP